MLTEKHWRFQSTFPQRERRFKGYLYRSAAAISIHVPAKGTTKHREGRPYSLDISIHVPAKGTTRNKKCNSHYAKDFNPRSRKGNDGKGGKQFLRCTAFQSTFPQRERRRVRALSSLRGLFQSTFPQRERLQYLLMFDKISLFQSTFPQRERLTAVTRRARRTDFNPRSCKGNDVAGSGPLWIINNFNPRSCKGNDLTPLGGFSHAQISIHVPAKGTTQSIFEPVLSNLISIHVPAKGTTERPSSVFRSTFNFNPRSRKGNDDTESCSCPSQFHFNPRSRKGNDVKLSL